MLKSLTQLSFAAMFALAAPLVAQESSTTPETEGSGTTQSATTAETIAETSNDNGLDLGQPVDAGPKVGERYSKEKHGDWDLVCVKTDTATDPCSIIQVLTDATGNPMAEFTMFRINQPGGQAVAAATVIVPLETLLTAALTISVDGAPGKRYNYKYCNSQVCIAEIGLTQSDIDAFKKGTAATLSLRPAPAPDQIIDMKMSLKGFTAGYDVVDIVEP
ncbi:invasion associated locus B family protein [Parasedimentitalea psychrophila]|uniref:Invasion associated locus B family protein n=1 Tax=Parasedimentitalea psychrophila TaxID=2997337 RepID=A0A9Y2KX05_9RHOB|nr:invasion associated locus B family protein [Parasedimentitalea psychrophila]WIY24680.1 invasion associated locus B family protein [Parasedimentitalea psychrophila]